jgi:hypothetical protein
VPPWYASHSGYRLIALSKPAEPQHTSGTLQGQAGEVRDHTYVYMQGDRLIAECSPHYRPLLLQGGPEMQPFYNPNPVGGIIVRSIARGLGDMSLVQTPHRDREGPC